MADLRLSKTPNMAMTPMTGRSSGGMKPSIGDESEIVGNIEQNPSMFRMLIGVSFEFIHIGAGQLPLHC